MYSNFHVQTNQGTSQECRISPNFPKTIEEQNFSMAKHKARTAADGEERSQPVREETEPPLTSPASQISA
jgi:hypothetical protein